MISYSTSSKLMVGTCTLRIQLVDVNGDVPVPIGDPMESIMEVF
ncbi:hypothetical protein ABES58_28970 [Paenibacillus lautus]